MKGSFKIPNAALRYKPTPPEGPDGKPIVRRTPLAKGQGRVHVLTSDKPGEEKEEMKVIAVGITDGISTEVKSGALPPGTKVITRRRGACLAVRGRANEDERKRREHGHHRINGVLGFRGDHQLRGVAKDYVSAAGTVHALRDVRPDDRARRVRRHRRDERLGQVPT